MKINTKDLYYPASVAFRMTVSENEKWSAGDRQKAAKSNLKARGLNKELSHNTYKEILELNGWECIEEPREGLFRKREMRTFEVFEDGSSIGNVEATTKAEACTIASKRKYGETETFKDQKGRTVLLWELNAKDMEAQEVI